MKEARAAVMHFNFGVVHLIEPGFWVFTTAQNDVT